MNAIEISKLITPSNRSNVFKGVFACDNLPSKVKLPAAFVINLSPITEPGSHWVALFIDDGGFCFYFDSFGLPPKNKSIIIFIRLHAKKFNFNKMQVQHITSIKCGMFCCGFIITVISGKPIKSYLRKFSSNLFINEIIINQMFKYMQSRK